MTLQFIDPIIRGEGMAILKLVETTSYYTEFIKNSVLYWQRQFALIKSELPLLSNQQKLL